MRDAAERLFEDESLSGDETAVDEVIFRAGGERAAIWAMMIELAGTRIARAATYRPHSIACNPPGFKRET